MRSLAFVALTSLSPLLCIIPSASSASYTLTKIDVPFPNVRYTAVNGINDRGEIVGIYADNSGNHGFLYDRGHFLTFDAPFPGATETNPQGINNHGEIVGIYRDGSDTVHGFLYDRGQFSTFDVPLAVETVPSGINDRGQIVGAYCMTGCRPTHDFLYDRGNFITIDVPFSGVGATRAFGINNRGQIVGNYDDSSGTHEFVYDENRFSRLGNFAFSTTARAVNDRGEIAGIFFDSAHHNFLYDRGQFNILPFPASAEALGINNRADIVGLYTDNFGLHGYVATK